MKSILSIVAIALMVSVSGCSEKAEKEEAAVSKLEQARSDVEQVKKSDDAKEAAKEARAAAEAKHAEALLPALAKLDAANKAVPLVQADVDTATAELNLVLAKVDLEPEALEAKSLENVASKLEEAAKAKATWDKAVTDLKDALEKGSGVAAAGQVAEDAKAVHLEANKVLKAAQAEYKALREKPATK